LPMPKFSTLSNIRWQFREFAPPSVNGPIFTLITVTIFFLALNSGPVLGSDAFCPVGDRSINCAQKPENSLKFHSLAKTGDTDSCVGVEHDKMIDNNKLELLKSYILKRHEIRIYNYENLMKPILNFKKYDGSRLYRINNAYLVSLIFDFGNVKAIDISDIKTAFSGPIGPISFYRSDGKLFVISKKMFWVEKSMANFAFDAAASMICKNDVSTSYRKRNYGPSNQRRGYYHTTECLETRLSTWKGPLYMRNAVFEWNCDSALNFQLVAHNLEDLRKLDQEIHRAMSMLPSFLFEN